MNILLHFCAWILALFQKTQASIHFWASEVTGFSSQYNSYSYSGNQILGRPNVFPQYGDTTGTWTQVRNQLDQVHFIEIKFRKKRILTEINIYETYHAGAVVRIAAKDPQNEWVDEINRAHIIKRARKFSPKIKEVKFQVDELRIEVDCSVSGSYVKLDAVEIVGGRCPKQFVQYLNSCYLIKTDHVSGDKALVSCLETGGYLVNLETLEEAVFLKNLLIEMKTGQPSGYPEDCMFFYAPDRYQIHDVRCEDVGHLGGYICEI